MHVELKTFEHLFMKFMFIFKKYTLNLLENHYLAKFIPSYLFDIISNINVLHYCRDKFGSLNRF